MDKTKHPSDPRGLVYEAYHIPGITAGECRSIFLDWALGINADEEIDTHVVAMLTAYSHGAPKHPMTDILREALKGNPTPKRRGGRSRVS